MTELPEISRQRHRSLIVQPHVMPSANNHIFNWRRLFRSPDWRKQSTLPQRCRRWVPRRSANPVSISARFESEGDIRMLLFVFLKPQNGPDPGPSSPTRLTRSRLHQPLKMMQVSRHRMFFAAIDFLFIVLEPLTKSIIAESVHALQSLSVWLGSACVHYPVRAALRACSAQSHTKSLHLQRSVGSSTVSASRSFCPCSQTG